VGVCRFPWSGPSASKLKNWREGRTSRPTCDRGAEGTCSRFGRGCAPAPDRRDLRHTFASTAVSAGQGLPIMGKLLGHTQVQMTARYAHLAADPVRRAPIIFQHRLQIFRMIALHAHRTSARGCHYHLTISFALAHVAKRLKILTTSTPIRALGSRIICSKYGHIGADVRPDCSPHVNKRHV
jgi:hypothetical protein